jgi:Na+-transporting methylmalonyl-CoA/oxaloacetate decarboxylase gamma subunit
MHTPNPPEQDPQKQHGLSSTGYGGPTPGYETSDVQVGGIVVFMTSLLVFLVIFFVICFVMGKVINNALIKHDGPPNKWNQFQYSPENRGKNLESNAVLEQQQLRAMTARFPTPRLQVDDGDQEVVDLHNREDLLLDHYTWVDRQQGVVRIPIGQAMQLIAQRGLPVVSGGPTQPPMTADVQPRVTAPLTNGFARTGYEQQLAVEQSRQQEQQKEVKPGEQARLTPAHP